jgi:hypothetical protein
LGPALLPQSLQEQLPCENGKGPCVHEKVVWLLTSRGCVSRREISARPSWPTLSDSFIRSIRTRFSVPTSAADIKEPDDAHGSGRDDASIPRRSPGLSLLNMGGLPKDERSRVGERGKRGAVLQCDWAAELRGPPAVSGAAPHRVPLTRCLGCRMERVARLFQR